MTAFGNYLAQTFIMLLVIVMLAVVVLWGAKKLGVGRPMGSLKLLGRLPLDARRSILLVQIGQRVLVVGSSEAGLTKLSELDLGQVPPLEPDSSSPPAFAAILARARAAARHRQGSATVPREESSDS